MICRETKELPFMSNSSNMSGRHIPLGLPLSAAFQFPFQLRCTLESRPYAHTNMYIHTCVDIYL